MIASECLPYAKTGGLADSVKQYDEINDEGNGFLFWDASPKAYVGVYEAALRRKRGGGGGIKKAFPHVTDYPDYLQKTIFMIHNPALP